MKACEGRNYSVCLSNSRKACAAEEIWGSKAWDDKSWRAVSIHVIQVKKDLDFTSSKRKATEKCLARS